MDTYWHKYQNDQRFRKLVDSILSHILKADFTPSEMRAAAMIASIKFEQMCFSRTYVVDKELENGLRVIEEAMLSRNEYKECDA